MRQRIALLIAALILPPAATAQPASPSPAQLADLKKLAIEELAETDITGSGRRPEQLEEIAAAVSVITSDDLRRYGVMNVPQALRLRSEEHTSELQSPCNLV